MTTSGGHPSTGCCHGPGYACITPLGWTQAHRSLYRWHTTQTPSGALVTCATKSLPRISSKLPKRGRATPLCTSSSRLRLHQGTKAVCSSVRRLNPPPAPPSHHQPHIPTCSHAPRQVTPHLPVLCHEAVIHKFILQLLQLLCRLALHPRGVLALLLLGLVRLRLPPRLLHQGCRERRRQTWAGRKRRRVSAGRSTPAAPRRSSQPSSKCVRLS